MASTVEIPFTGGCACGAVRYECGAAPLRMVNCHCRDCQLASGGAYSPTAIASREAFKLTKGETAVFEKIAESGNTAYREFCAFCGTPLFASSSGGKALIGIKAASLDDPSWFRAEPTCGLKARESCW